MKKAKLLKITFISLIVFPIISFDYIFYGTDGHTYLVELCYSIGNHPIGLLSPGILKK